MKVYSYIVAYHSGFSPNPFHGVCTLACCKPMIRRSARVGDLIVGLSRRAERVVYAMTVGRVVDFAGPGMSRSLHANVRTWTRQMR